MVELICRFFIGKQGENVVDISSVHFGFISLKRPVSNLLTNQSGKRGPIKKKLKLSYQLGPDKGARTTLNVCKIINN